MLFAGIDLGTSAVKIILMDENGTILKNVSRSYPLNMPEPGWSEQNPDDWFNETLHGMKELMKDIPAGELAGLSFGGQMHGLVILDENDEVIRPAILWNDGRTSEECGYLNGIIGKDELSDYTANIAFAGFTAPKILWLKKHEPENYKRIKKIMLPKDYLVYRFTGNHVTDVSDASGMLLLDVKNRCWSLEMCDICGVEIDTLPKLYESYESVGYVRPEIAKVFGAGDNLIVAAGAGDNAAAAIATGTIGEGMCNISLGTSGTLFVSRNKFGVDQKNALHSFCDAAGGYHLLGCMLSAASCNKWWMEDILKTDDYNLEQKEIVKLGQNSVFFMPYLMGERSPHNDPYIRASFIGMSMSTTRLEMTQAVMEGVAYGIRDAYEVACEMGIVIKRSKLVGGGAKSALWCNIMANIMGIPMDLLEVEEGPALGAAMLAAVACGRYKNAVECAESIVRVKETIMPVPEITAAYNDKYETFKKLYPALRSVFHTQK